MSIIIYANHWEMTNKISRKILITTSVKNQFFRIFIILCVLRICRYKRYDLFVSIFCNISCNNLSSVMLKMLYFTCLILRFHVCFYVYMCIPFLIFVSMTFEVQDLGREGSDSLNWLNCSNMMINSFSERMNALCYMCTFIILYDTLMEF